LASFKRVLTTWPDFDYDYLGGCTAKY
jgi:hypothetical protein